MKIQRYVLAALLIFLLISILPVFRASARFYESGPVSHTSSTESSTTIAVNPPESNVTYAKTFSVDINVANVANLTSWQFTVYFLNSVLNCTGVVEGPFLKTGGGTYFAKNVTNNYNSTYGNVLAYSTLLGNTSVSGSGVLATITFNASSVGNTTLHLSDTKLGDQQIPPQPIAHTTVDGTVHVQNFTLAVVTLGLGAVSLNNTGPYYHYGDAVLLSAVPAAGWSFKKWTGDLSSSANPAILVMTRNMFVVAWFTQDQYALTVIVVGGGSVSKSPDQATYTWGTNVTLVASAGVGWSFAGWSGDASGTTNPITINMTGNKTVTGTFTQNVYTLTVSVVGGGSVTLNNTGPYYHYGDAVLLSAVPSAGWSFGHWSGDLSGSANPATLTITGNMSITATFTQNVYALTVNVFGSGFVTLNNTGPNYHYGDVVLLTAVPNTGWSFDHWSGDLSGSANPTTIIMTGNISVTATFVQINYALTVSVVGTGFVTLNNTGPNYHYGDVVLLTAVPSAGWSFQGWSGNLTGSTNPATLVIAGNMSVAATFTQDQYALTVIVVGGGSVSKSPDQATYTWGTNVTLVASAGVGWSFAGWSGDASGTTNPTTVNMTGNMSVNATFTQNVYTLTTLVDGSGSVTLNNTGPYHYGDAVLLTASGFAGWTFHYWTGDLSGSDNPATLVMTGNFSVTAHFILKPTLQMSPSSKTCRVYGENFTVTVSISDAVNVEDFEFEIHYNATLLRYMNVTWNAWGSGTISVNETTGIIIGFTWGAPFNGTQSAVTIQFQAACHHVWKDAPGWTNDLTDTIFLQSANLSYPTGPKLRYEKGGLNEINVGPDFVYTFSPIQGDVNNDSVVDIFDLRSVAVYYNVKQGDSNWTEASTYDLNGDGIIDITDLRIAAAYFGYTYNP